MFFFLRIRNRPNKQQNEDDEEGEQERGPCQPRLVSRERTSRPTLLVQAFVEETLAPRGGEGVSQKGGKVREKDSKGAGRNRARVREKMLMDFQGISQVAMILGDRRKVE